MKRIVLLGLAAIPGCLFAQGGAYTLKGKVNNYNAPSKVFLIHAGADENTITDSAVLANGQFSFKGTVAEPVPAVLILDVTGKGLKSMTSRPDGLRLFLEKGDLVVSASDSLSKAAVTGKVNEEDKKLKGQLKAVEGKMIALGNEVRAASPEKRQSREYMEGMGKRYEALMDEQNQVLQSFIRENPGSYVSLDAVKSLAANSKDPVLAESMISMLSDNLKESPSLQPLLSQLESQKRVAVGSLAMDFTQNDPSGKAVKLSDFRGKYVLLDFWASWCGPCRQENPNVVKAYNKYKDKNFTVLGVSLDRQNGKDAWLKAIKDDGLTWTHVSDLKFWQNEVAVKYGIQSIPKNFLIDPQGKIIATDLRGEELDSKLAEILH
ncbi:redoxin domain-containing protein [Arcticibacter sp. MXS-1]|uniref:redoxin domain-containing protein n=1 Tax=Arcticibacter sp. MXS-1 TaxID=3341726 RepID=UPI0035A980A7